MERKTTNQKQLTHFEEHAPQTYPPLASETRTHINTSHAGHLLGICWAAKTRQCGFGLALRTARSGLSGSMVVSRGQSQTSNAFWESLKNDNPNSYCRRQPHKSSP